MEVVKLTEENYFGVFLQAEKMLHSGGVIVAPTDTVYGLLGNAEEPKAVKKIFAIKKRKETEALPIFVKDISMARKYVYISDSKAKFLDKVWPGQVTVVFHHKEKLPRDLTGKKDTIGLRCPDNRFILELIGRLEAPIVQTSANVSGKPPAKNIQEIRNYFEKEKNKPDLVIDGGEILGQASMVIGFTGLQPVILRTGILNKADFDQMMSSMI